MKYLTYDLHAHTYYSDGVCSPDAVVVLAAQNGVKTLAITDHDTVEGLAEARKSAKTHDIQLIPGIELSARWHTTDVHVVGLQIDASHPELQAGISILQTYRQQRALAIAEKLESLGIHDALGEVTKIANHRMICRPHFAQLLVAQGKVKDIRTAFDRYLKRDKPAYVPCEWPSMETVIAWIIAAKGIPVLAHPARYLLNKKEIRQLIRAFKAAAGTAIEVVTKAHTAEQTHQMARLANEYGLYASAGSDFHGQTYAELGQLPLLPPSCQPVWHCWDPP